MSAFNHLPRIYSLNTVSKSAETWSWSLIPILPWGRHNVVRYAHTVMARCLHIGTPLLCLVLSEVQLRSYFCTNAWLFKLQFINQHSKSKTPSFIKFNCFQFKMWWAANRALAAGGWLLYTGICTHSCSNVTAVTVRAYSCCYCLFKTCLKVHRTYSSVGIATGYGRGSSPGGGKRLFLDPQRPDRLWGPPRLRAPAGEGGGRSTCNRKTF
jgi:hypothetical protein